MLSLFADQEREAKLDSLGDSLILLNKHIDFHLMAEEIDRWVRRPSCAKGGRPPYPAELMTRLLVLQQFVRRTDGVPATRPNELSALCRTKEHCARAGSQYDLEFS